ncbi:MAG: tRNA lysidine(34) synthetase TilS [Lachnospiraceae bacterium]|nr:tRNA lysidine(34) synthetase TilS [Lachnospiraceae bacterium]
MINRVIRYIKEHRMIDEGDCVVAGISGGADSVCLFIMLLEIRRVIPMEIRVVHINHLIREDAAADAAYVERLCRSNDIAFTLIEENVETLAGKLHISVEEAGRNVRYEAFYKELGSRKGRIAIAHNKNDSCETLLFHLFRGSSLKGLAGIPPVRDKIIRPLLCLERNEIEAFLQRRGITYCIDSTNLEDNYSRNIIRHHILATAVKEISPSAVNHISNACRRVSEAYDLVEDITRQGYDVCVHVTQGDGNQKKYHIDREKFFMLHTTIQGYVVMEVLADASGSRKDLEAVHIGQVCELMNRQCGKEVRLPYSLRAKRDYKGVCIYKETDKTPQETALQEIMVTEDMTAALMAGETVEMVLGPHQKICAVLVEKSDICNDLENIPQKKYTKWIDYDKIKNSIVIRTRRQGDYLTVNTMNQRKTLKTYFIDHKIPQEERGRIWLVADGGHIVWVVGQRISSYYKIGENTRRILCLTFEDEEQQAGNVRDTKEEQKWLRESGSC